MEGFNARLREERERLGYSQAKFAELCGVGKTAQYTYEAGGRLPGIEYIAAAMDLGASLPYLISGVRLHQETQAEFLARLDGLADDRLLTSALVDFDLEGFRLDMAKMASGGERDLNRLHAGIADALIARSRSLSAMVERAKEIDADLLAEVLEGIDQVQSTAPLPVAKKAKLAAMLYRAFSIAGKVDAKMIVDAVGVAQP